LSIVPKALLRRLYRKGSLKPADNCIKFELKNILGPGIITGINYVKLNEMVFEPEKILIDTNGKKINATAITPENPILFTFGQRGICVLLGKNCLIEGKNIIELELVSREAGLINVSVNDTVTL
jgi:hypothetical protein